MSILQPGSARLSRLLGVCVQLRDWNGKQPVQLLVQILAGKAPGTTCDVPPFNLEICVERRWPSDPLYVCSRSEVM